MTAGHSQCGLNRTVLVPVRRMREFKMGMQAQAGPWQRHQTDAISTNDSRGDILSPGKRDDDVPLSRLIYLDYRRYFAAGARNALSVIVLTQGFWASTI